ncbi:hypothetical protein [Streptomyces sp. NPDC053427]|uniref:hypothetical protein n=1 Tax=Streptomyces sp. NPDC053427 TaxID=3365701 RepID=UPI0037CCEA9D
MTSSASGSDGAADGNGDDVARLMPYTRKSPQICGERPAIEETELASPRFAAKLRFGSVLNLVLDLVCEAASSH